MEKCCGSSPDKKQQKRTLPVDSAQKIADNLKDKGYCVWSIQYPQQIQLSNVNIPLMDIKNNNPILMSQRYLFALIKLCKTTICIDSFVQHACAALNKKAIVLWGGTNPQNLGYKEHQNIFQEVCPTPFCSRPNSFLFDGEHMGNVWECPYDEKCLEYKPEKISKLIE